MSLAPERIGIGLRRSGTTPGVHPYDAVAWERRDARITNYRDGAVAFEQLGVEFPVTWSLNATNIVAQKYFRGTQGTPERESSLKQVIDRVADTITDWGVAGGYFLDDTEADTFRDELKHLLVTQKAAFNSPVWFNIGVKGVPQQASACFILSVDDSMDSILNWYREEGVIFKGGSGSGVNLSKIRSSFELLKGGGTASGPVSFMRGADASAGTIKSGGKTRRAAKMVILDASHPDVEEFIWCKAKEERKARVLRDAGFDMDLDGSDSFSIQYQNANNSVRVTDEFMEAVEADADWDLTAVMTGEVIRTMPARELFRDIALAAWECADPGMQFDTTINRWHTAHATGRINGSNPCSEYMHLDNSACNLASLNLLKFLREDDTFDVEAYRAAIEVIFTAQEILVGNADYPTEGIAETSRQFRQLGLGYANLGALLMALGLPYDSDGGRALAAALTALMTGHAYATSARIAGRMGPFAGFAANEEHMLRVLRMHRDAASCIDEELVATDLLSAAQASWDEAVAGGEEFGVRNSQASVLAPTGTIGLMMDCDTTGIEPDLGLVKFKKLVGGGSMSIVNQTVPRALRRLGYNAGQIADVIAYIDEHKTIVGSPVLRAEHLPVFACSMGDNTIHYTGHVRMMGAVQPFISGAISKTVNMPEEATIEEVEALHLLSWQLGLKAVAIYRDNCKVGQPLSTAKKDDPALVLEAAPQIVERIVEKLVHAPIRQKLPRTRTSKTFEFRVADCKGFATIGEYADGRPGEIFLTVSKQGSTLSGIMDAFAKAISYGLQYGVPLRAFVEAFTNMRFEPTGMTDDPDIRFASSIMDYLFRRLALEYLTYEERAELSIFSIDERMQPTLPGVEESVTETVQGTDMAPDPKSIPSANELAQQMQIDASPLAAPEPPAVAASDAPLCMQCGVHMQRAGSCLACPSCGSTAAAADPLPWRAAGGRATITGGMGTEGIVVERQGPMAVVRLDRPEKLNVFTFSMIRALRALWSTKVAADPAVVAVVVTGTGRAFSAGLDTGDLARSASGMAPAHAATTGSEDLPALFSHLLRVPKPVVAAVNGVAAGGGFVLAMMCDLRFAAESASFTTAFSKRGLIAEHGTSWLLPRLVGLNRALDLLLSSRRVSAEEAYRIGFVDRVVPDGELLAVVRAYVDELAANASPRSLAVMKRQLYGDLSLPLEAALRGANEEMAAALGHPDATEGVESFVERRPPRFVPWTGGTP